MQSFRKWLCLTIEHVPKWDSSQPILVAKAARSE